MKIVAVIGAGTMGNGIAHVFAQKKYKVHLIERFQSTTEKALSTISKNLDRMIDKEVIEPIVKEQTLNNIHTFSTISEGVKGADIVIEAIVEDVSVKKDFFRQLDACCPPKTILASNTSSISITELASVTNRPKQVIGMHFMNPVPLMSLVEVIKGQETSRETVQECIDLAIKLEKTPIEANDFPGFVANRILMPMINEAIEALNQGVATVEAIDGIMKLGMAHPMGPLQLADYIGLDVCLSILNVMYDGFNNPKYTPNTLLVKMVEEGDLGVKSGEGFYDYSKSRKAEVISKRFI